MFYSITGTVVYTDESSIAVDCNGVAFHLATSLNTLKACGNTGEKVTLFTYLAVREDALDLFGFYEKNELDCFKLLISVTGVGPKAAVAILSALTPDRLAIAVAGNDVKAITSAQGVGPKIANRIILELQGKTDSFGASSAAAVDIAAAKKSGISNAGEDAVNALVMLGYSKSEASIAVGKLDGGLTTEQMIKKALVLLAKNL